MDGPIIGTGIYGVGLFLIFVSSLVRSWNGTDFS